MPPLVKTRDAIDLRLSNLKNADYDYDYPEGLDLRPGTDFHKDLVSRILSYANESSTYISNKFPAWREIDRTLTAFVELDDKEEEVKFNDARKPVSIVFPYTYAMMESLLSYLTSAFFQEPLFRYEGTSSEDVIGAILLEKVIDIHCNKTKVMLNLHTMFRDSIAYGVGFVSPYWKREVGLIEKKGSGLFGGLSRSVEEGVIFEGNAIGNIDPYLSLPDPNVPIQDIQEGEFFGWVERTNYLDLLSEEKSGSYFNVKYLKSVHNKQTSIYGEDKSDRDARLRNRNSTRYHPLSSWGGRIKGISESTNPTDVIHMICKVIPREWKLGPSEYPEKWIFTIGADSVVLRAKPIKLNHNKFPVAAAAPDFDGYSMIPVSRLEMLYGMQGVLDWMFNAHVANVRKTINDVLIYDPYLINSKDINSPEPGKRIRIRRPGWGRGVKDAVQQLPVNDITRQHIADSSWIVQWMQKISAVDEASMGTIRQGGPERVTAAEVQGTEFGKLSRLGRIAKVIGLQAMQDIGSMFASHTKQLISQDVYVKVIGDWQQVLMKEYGVNKLAKDRGRINVTPYDLLVNYDVLVRDGSVPGGNFSEVWLRMFDTIANHPELHQEFDLSRIFMHIARNSGAKNVQDFVRVKVAPDEQVLQQQERGNVIPLDEAGIG